MPTAPGQTQSSIMAAVVLCTARLLVTAILAIWLFFIAAHLLGDAGADSRPLHFGDYLILTTMTVQLLGLGLALRWPRCGALITLAAAAVVALWNWTLLPFPPAFVPALLFLLYSHLADRAQRAGAI